MAVRAATGLLRRGLTVGEGARGRPGLAGLGEGWVGGGEAVAGRDGEDDLLVAVGSAQVGEGEGESGDDVAAAGGVQGGVGVVAADPDLAVSGSTRVGCRSS